MANNLWSNYTEKTATPVDADEVMVRDSTDGKNKRLLFGTFWKWIAKKLNEATISELETDNKTVVGAINYLYGKSLKKIRFKNSTASNSVIITKKDPYNPVVVIISNNGNLFFYIDSAFKGQIIVDNSYCSIERTSNKEFKVTNTGYGEALIFSSDNVTIN